MSRRLLAIIVALLVCGMALAVVFAENINRERFASAERDEVQHSLTVIRDALEVNLTSNIQLVKGMVGVIALTPDLDQRRFELAANSLFSDATLLRSVAIAPDMVIRQVYPRLGNESVIGADYRELPGQFAAVEQARMSRKIIVAGPLKLIQGGVGLVARLPVYLPGRDGQEYFWGVISAVIDADKLYAASGLLDKDLPIEIAIRGKDASGPSGDVFYGRPELFKNAPVLADIHLPYGTWQIAAVPHGGWSPEPDNLWSLRLGIALIALLVLGAFLALGRALRLTAQAAERVEASVAKFLQRLRTRPMSLSSGSTRRDG